MTVIGAKDAHGILGREVRSAANEDMGRIVDAIVDREGNVRAAVIERKGPRTLAVTHVNVDTLEVLVAPVPDTLERELILRVHTRSVPLADDVKDWQRNLSSGERNLLTQIFRFFTQADVEVQDCYHDKYGRVFKPTEVKMMLASFANMETIHIAAYALLLETIGIPVLCWRTGTMPLFYQREVFEATRTHADRVVAWSRSAAPGVQREAAIGRRARACGQ